VSGAQRIKHNRGRPKFPASYWLAILDTVDGVCRNRGCGVEEACYAICDRGGIKWINYDYQPDKVGIKTVTKIGNAKVLSNRYYKARAFVRTHGIPNDQPRIRWPRIGWPRHQLVVSRYTGGYEGRLRRRLVRRDRIVFYFYADK